MFNLFKRNILILLIQQTSSLFIYVNKSIYFFLTKRILFISEQIDCSKKITFTYKQKKIKSYRPILEKTKRDYYIYSGIKKVSIYFCKLIEVNKYKNCVKVAKQKIILFYNNKIVIPLKLNKSLIRKSQIFNKTKFGYIRQECITIVYLVLLINIIYIYITFSVYMKWSLILNFVYVIFYIVVYIYIKKLVLLYKYSKLCYSYTKRS